MQVVMKISCCLAVLILTQNVRADQQELPAAPIPNVIGIGSGPGVQGTPLYDNTDQTQGIGLFRIGGIDMNPATEFADDVPFTGTYHVTSFVFGYVTNQPDGLSITVNWYSGLDATDGPDPASLAQSVTLTGLPGSPDGSAVGYTVDPSNPIDLTGVGADFDWTNSVAAGTGTPLIPPEYNFGWFSLACPMGTSPFFLDGGASLDVFETDRDVRPPFTAGDHYWFFGGNPKANFYLQVSTQP